LPAPHLRPRLVVSLSCANTTPTAAHRCAESDHDKTDSVKGALRTRSPIMAQLPYAIDAETPLNPAELAVLRAQYEKEGDMVGVQTKFNYAWGLVKSNTRADQQLGVILLSEIFRTSPERRRECLFYLALGNFKLGNYGEARRYNDKLLEMEPVNLQAADLSKLIDEKVAKEGLMGVAIISGVAVGLGVIGGFLLRNMRSNSR